MHVQVGKVFHLDEIVEARRCMEESRAGGKMLRSIHEIRQLVRLSLLGNQDVAGRQGWVLM
jgi:hypothetical protein